jgi:hypothetical protein
MDKVERLFPQPWFLEVIDFEAAVGRNPGSGISIIQYTAMYFPISPHGIPGAYHVGCIGLRSTPIT